MRDGDSGLENGFVGGKESVRGVRRQRHGELGRVQRSSFSPQHDRTVFDQSVAKARASSMAS